jgi:hypothetical protein
MLCSDDLIPMLHHVQYEIRHCMLIPEWRDDANIMKEAIFLSFFVHARMLIHFFEDSEGRPDDVFSADFGFSTVKLPLPSEVNTRFGKDMMHLTTKRLRHTHKSKPWPIRETYSAIKPTATSFVDHIIATFGPKLPEQEQPLWKELQGFLHDTGSQMIVAKE